MKAGYWVLIFVAVLILIYGYNMGWFSGGTGWIGGKGFPKNPKEGDKFMSLNNGKQYQYMCFPSPCLPNSPCPPPSCSWRIITTTGPVKVQGQTNPSSVATTRSQSSTVSRTAKINKGGVYTANGTPVNIGPGQKQMTCNDWCIEQGGTGGELEQYPPGSIYHPYYYCGCRKATTS